MNRHTCEPMIRGAGTPNRRRVHLYASNEPPLPYDIAYDIICHLCWRTSPRIALHPRGTTMKDKTSGLRTEIAALRGLSTRELRALHLQVFGPDVKVRNREYLFKRLAFRLQERAHSGQLSTRRRGKRGRLMR